MTWHQWHHTALIASKTGTSRRLASAKASSPHSRHSISLARFGRGEKRNAAICSLPRRPKLWPFGPKNYGKMALRSSLRAIDSSETGGQGPQARSVGGSHVAIEQQETGTEATPVVSMTTRASDKLKE